eukprot:GDKJ01003999.1.p1 GENE.GDKJ01003999.1~~GDKJ01003999.1.p1  ORF type:complete len:217 (+),score=-5.27 GDKJ01003999.1:266-916(+)
MKKIFITLCLVAFLSYSTFAQKVRVGFNGGLTYSGFRGNPQIKSFDAGFDFLAGITFEYQLKDKLSLVTGINYDRKSASQKLYTEIIENPEDPGFAGKVKICFRNQFITVPVYVKYDFGTNNSFYLNGGAFISYILKSELSNDYDDTKLDQTDALKSIDYGLVFGLGKTFKLKNNNEITLEIRENLGLANIAKNSNDGDIRTNSLNLVCGYSFDFK